MTLFEASKTRLAQLAAIEHERLSTDTLALRGSATQLSQLVWKRYPLASTLGVAGVAAAVAAVAARRSSSPTPRPAARPLSGAAFGLIRALGLRALVDSVTGPPARAPRSQSAR